MGDLVRSAFDIDTVLRRRLRPELRKKVEQERDKRECSGSRIVERKTRRTDSTLEIIKIVVLIVQIYTMNDNVLESS